MKKCTKCGQAKVLAEFHVTRRNKDGRKSECKECSCLRTREYSRRYPDRIADTRRKARERDPGAQARYDRAASLKRKFGITQAHYESMLAAQNGMCAICGSTEPKGRSKSFHVDHCHATENIRGLLCSECNLGLGKFHDDAGLIRRALEYLDGPYR